MIEKENCHKRHGERGHSSFGMHDPKIIFRTLGLKPGDNILDLGCGSGDYALEALKYVGPSGKVYAVDISQSLVERLKKQIKHKGYFNIEVFVADITKSLPFETGSINVCLLSTVLHIYNLKQTGRKIFQEVHRVLRPGGRMVVLECKKESAPFGPPVHMRISPEEVKESAIENGFNASIYIDLGYTYLIQFISVLIGDYLFNGK
jgi:ubiquinone/menaquinone biosynthesis C-methylase UbiE